MVGCRTGNPGDHPLTDVLVRGLEVFGPRADTLIREIVRLGGRLLLAQNVALYRADPRVPSSDRPSPDLPTLERHLTQLRDALREARSQPVSGPRQIWAFSRTEV
jgi:hypothetical protein